MHNVLGWCSGALTLSAQADYNRWYKGVFQIGLVSGQIMQFLTIRTGFR